MLRRLLPGASWAGSPSLAMSQGNPWPALAPRTPVGLCSPCLEKRSQALQACNLTRNIQADGAPMVHPPWRRANLQGAFSPSDTGAMPPKTHRHAGAKRHATVRSPCGCGRFLFASAGAQRSPMHLSGTLLERRFMKMKERSKKRSGFIHAKRNSAQRVHATNRNSAPHAVRNRPHRDPWAAAGAVPARSTQSGW